MLVPKIELNANAVWTVFSKFQRVCGLDSKSR